MDLKFHLTARCALYQLPVIRFHLMAILITVSMDYSLICRTLTFQVAVGAIPLILYYWRAVES